MPLDTVDALIKILKTQLGYLPDTTIFFRVSTGEAINGSELITLIERDDPIATEYIETILSVAVRMVRSMNDKRIPEDVCNE